MSEGIENPQAAVDDALESAISQIDITKITKDDVFHDIMHQAKFFAFRLTVAAALMEKLFIRDQINEAQLHENQGSGESGEKP